MTDPRIKRTRLHVLETTRRMLSERNGETITLSSLAKEAEVSRRTLYVHWGTIEQVISEAVSLAPGSDGFDPEGLSNRERVVHFLTSVRDGIHEPITKVALTSLIHHATQEDKAVASMDDMSDKRLEQLRELIGPVTEEQFAQLVGPVYFSELVLHKPASDTLIESLADVAVELVGAGEPAASK
ncbi:MULTISPECIES: TetR/AcrR family transcriptional regulator [unclassified Agreia]|uniref:TetR/AcrR family transcriptional regulator n=1 Tax=unclassified Agreia TaxID=2641148 RepID=UPI0012F7C779|nr:MULTISPECIES: TetR/AcrR family transcriptional regulator [unclassified Agreia]